MSKQDGLISDYEQLFKLKKFYNDKKREPYECTYEQISRSLKNEYIGNIDSKIERWINISRVLYFKDAASVRFYLQAKMLFRDGFYEAAITMSRSICEMICYEKLIGGSHPFGDYKDIELENFRTLVKYIAIPKEIDRNLFDKDILEKLNSTDDKNFLKSSYQLNSDKKKYLFKVENGKSAKNLNRFFTIFDSINFKIKDNFPNNSFQTINQVYDNGNIYVHARKSSNTPKVDAINNLNGICEVLYELYGINEIPLNQTIKSGYAGFPDICTGMNFAIDVYATPADAMRGYLNLPTQKQIEKMISIKGAWEGEWYSKKNVKQKGKLTFFLDGEYLKGELVSFTKNKTVVTEPLDIKLFGEYFRIKGFNTKSLRHDKHVHNHFELEFFNNEILIGTNLNKKGKVLFKRID
jgi:hypothetical protein